MITVQIDNFDIEQEHNRLVSSGVTGATVAFVGRVRDFNGPNKYLYLQHYPGMTEKSLQQIADDANTHFDLHDITIIHRVGVLQVNDNIVFAGTASAHRHQAFLACEYIMDRLKTEAPFWKKEGETWVQANDKDNKARLRWKDYSLE